MMEWISSTTTATILGAAVGALVSSIATYCLNQQAFREHAWQERRARLVAEFARYLDRVDPLKLMTLVDVNSAMLTLCLEIQISGIRLPDSFFAHLKEIEDLAYKARVKEISGEDAIDRLLEARHELCKEFALAVPTTFHSFPLRQVRRSVQGTSDQTP